MWAETAPKAAADLGKGAQDSQTVPEKTKDEKLEDEVEKLTREVDETLNLSKWHEEKVRKDHLAPQPAQSNGRVTSHEDPKGDLSHIFPSRDLKPGANDGK